MFTLVLRLLGLPSTIYGNRNVVISILASVVLYPLCILKDLTALSSVSVFGIFGHLAAMAALGLRVLDKSYFTGGAYSLAASTLTSTAAKTAATVAVSKGAAIVSNTATASIISLRGFRGGGVASKWLVLASLLSYCFVTHYNVCCRYLSYE